MGRRGVKNSGREKYLAIRKNRRQGRQREPNHAPCLRCNSTNTKFLFYNNNSLSQPRYWCYPCRNSWTHGGTIRDHRGKKTRRMKSSDKEAGMVDSGWEKGAETNNTDGKELVRKRNESEESEQTENNEEADGKAHGDNHTGKLKIGRGQKGRKRKSLESSVHNGDDDTQIKKVQEVSCGGKAQVVGRILRPRTLATTTIEKTVDVGLVEGVLGGTGRTETDISTRNSTEIEDCDSAQLIDRQKKKRKGKVQGKSGALKAIGCEKQKVVEIRENGDQLKSKKATRSSKFQDNGKHNRLASKLHLASQKIVVKSSKRSKQNEEGGRAKSTEKQLLRNRIIAMLTRAG